MIPTMFKRVVGRSLHSIPAVFASSKPVSSTSVRFLSIRCHFTTSGLSSPLLHRPNVTATAISTSVICAFCSACVPSSVLNEREVVLPKVILYQYEPCPYCCKVKAVLDYLKLPYAVVEVNPMTKKELAAFTDYRKVPVVRINDEVIVDSSAIISQLWKLRVHPKKKEDEEEAWKEEEEQWCEWVDTKLILLTPPNIYRTMSEACQAFDYCLTEGNFTTIERHLSKYTGAVVMYVIAKRLKKKYDIQDERLALYSALNTWVDGIGDKRPFLGGDKPNMADLSVFGVVRAMHGLDTYDDIMRETKIEPWFTRMTAKVGHSSRLGINQTLCNEEKQT